MNKQLNTTLKFLALTLNTLATIIGIGLGFRSFKDETSWLGIFAFVLLGFSIILTVALEISDHKMEESEAQTLDNFENNLKETLSRYRGDDEILGTLFPRVIRFLEEETKS